jgi:ATP-dependent DNA helicase RecQ
MLFDPSDLRIQEHLQAKGRSNPAQARRAVDALVAWLDEGKPVKPRELALSARVPVTSARSVCTQLEELGLIQMVKRGEYTSSATTRRIRAGATDLAARLETRRIQDARHLQTISAYAETEDCRSAFIRRYFGESRPPKCGTCDNCRR